MVLNDKLEELWPEKMIFGIWQTICFVCVNWFSFLVLPNSLLRNIIIIIKTKT